EKGSIIEQGNIITSKLFQDGYVTVHDQSSMLVAEMLQIQAGLEVLDARSAPGGKATHIAEKMQNEGEIHAHDLHKKKIKLIVEKAATRGLTNIVASQADARNLQKVYQEETFDRILVDAPCSGL